MLAQEQHVRQRRRARRRQITNGPDMTCPPSSNVKEGPCLLAWLEGAAPLTVEKFTLEPGKKVTGRLHLERNRAHPTSHGLLT